jgi:hypothetical protein
VPLPISAKAQQYPKYKENWHFYCSFLKLTRSFALNFRGTLPDKVLEAENHI